MIIIFLILFVISIDIGLATKNSSINRLILFNSCQGNNHNNNNGLESTRLNNQKYYIHFSNRSSSTSFLLVLSLVYCEHQQTTHSSSSGFAILHSSPRFLFTHIDNAQRTSSFHHHHHNASSSIVDQLLSSTPILTLMSSNENNPLVDSDYDNTTTTTIDSFLSSTTITRTVSNVSLSQTTQRGTNRTFNIALLIGCISASIILIIIIIYAFVKYRNRDEGSYKIDESTNFVPIPHLEHHDNGGCRGKIPSSTHHRQKLLTTNEQNGVDSREWYV